MKGKEIRRWRVRVGAGGRQSHEEESQFSLPLLHPIIILSIVIDKDSVFLFPFVPFFLSNVSS